MKAVYGRKFCMALVIEGAIAQILLGFGLPNPALAQSITLDGTLHPARTLTGADYRIRQTDGRTVGRNLFHSFGRFNLNTGESVTFESAPDIRNIITRVTGGTPSSIDGLIQTQSHTVNLFLINPNGIVFGRNASLNVGGSFVASTANSFQFANGNEFSAIAPQAPSLLMINVPIGLQYGRQPEAITSQANLSVGSGRSLVLAGGEINLTNSNLEVNLPQGGRIELGSVGDAGTLGLNHPGNLLSLSFPANLERGRISLSNSVLDTRATDGGEIAITGRSISVLEGSRIRAGIASDYGLRGSQAGNITLNAERTLQVDGGSSIENTVAAATGTDPSAIGNAGDINISTGSLSVRNGAQLLTTTFGRGNAGSVIIEARDRVELEDSDSAANSGSGGILQNRQVIAQGRGGDVRISTDILSVSKGAQLNAASTGGGNAGNIIINANVIALEQGNITTEARLGNGGSITLRNVNLLLLLQNSRISTSAGTAQASGNGGSITLNVNLIAASADANNDITANAFRGQGGAVNITGQLAGLEILSRDELQTQLGTSNPQKLDPRSLPTNDITAISQNIFAGPQTKPGPGLFVPRAQPSNGQVTVNIPDLDPSRGLTELPTSVVDRSTQIARGCTPRGQDSGRFVVTGRGGLPLSPDEALRDRAILSPDWVTLDSEVEGGTVREGERASEQAAPENAIVEADGLGRDVRGKVVLVARSHSTEQVGAGTLQTRCDRP